MGNGRRPQQRSRSRSGDSGAVTPSTSSSSTGYSSSSSSSRPWSHTSLRVSRKLHAIRNDESPVFASPPPSSDVSSEISSTMGDESVERPQNISSSSTTSITSPSPATSTNKAPLTFPVLTISSDTTSLDTEHTSLKSAPASTERRKGEDSPSPLPSRTASRKQKYFSEEAANKNVFKKYFHPSFHQRSLQFRKLFGKSLPEEEQLLYSFSCAFQREILAQGRMFISQRHVSFYANIFSWETNFSIPIRDVTAITKEKAAKIFPNSIQIETSQGDKYFFASFVNREKSYGVLNKVWQSVQSSSVISPEDLWEWMNADTDEREKSSAKKKAASPVADSKAEHSKSNSLLVGEPAPEDFPATPADGTLSRTSSSDTAADEVVCPCESHQGKLLVDEVYALPVEQLFRLLFSDTPWFERFADSLRGTQHAKQYENVSGYVAGSWATDKDGVKQRTVTYTMALNHSMGPKSCVATEKQVCTHLGRPADGFVVVKETHNAGIPYADSFFVHCSYCVTRVGDGQSRLKIHGGIVYRKNIWSVVRGYIEKSTYTGLDEHYAALESVLAQHCGGAKKEARDTLTPENAHVVFEKLGHMRTQSSASDEELDVSPLVSPRRLTALPSSISANFNYVPADREDVYGPYIKVIVGLLLGLVLLNMLLLVRVYNIDTSPRVTLSEQFVEALRGDDGRVLSTKQQETLDALIRSVEQMGSDLAKLRSKKEL